MPDPGIVRDRAAGRSDKGRAEGTLPVGPAIDASSTAAGCWAADDRGAGTQDS